MSIAVCPGSFDPITLGHIDVIERALTMFDEVIVGVGRNTKKQYWFTDGERVALARTALSHLDHVRVELADGLTADFAADQGAQAIIKGLRGAADYDNEQAMALLNRHLSGIETVFVIGDPKLAHVASSYVKEIASFNGLFEDLVPANVALALHQKVLDRHSS